MLDHITIHVSDFKRSRAFYQSALAALGYVPRKTFETDMGFGASDPADADNPGGEFWIHEGTPCTPRVHVAFRARSRDEVDAFHRAALAAGGRDNGPPGLRPHYHPNYYGAFILDPDGYNVEAVCHRPA
ncbi:VOC family protein [Achromobacter mucicolens]|uniref:VOC family protein n=1 Tax=Achromobacter mucicolens TaxID=1389922 RepID=UPI0007C789AA|nr:VOC family protein [Achromobacter mucicolens]OAE58285.1 glyoxalase [Achromobacter xylosoxidans]PTX04506.1 VOC family protein [Achromobacter mucicolens]